MPGAVLALNAGSSSIKFGVYRIDESSEPRVTARGTLVTDSPSLVKATTPEGAPLLDRQVEGQGLRPGIAELLRWIKQDVGRLVACGHRVVHGGNRFSEPVLLTDAVLDSIDRLTPLAPLHQPRCVAPIRMVAELLPMVPQVGCFDTAFHATMTAPANRFALPRAYEEKGIRRFGFHGLSYEYVAGCLSDEGKVGDRTVVAHLGNGASLCAMKDGRSVDTTMGFSALDGLVMGTRCGAIDPGVLLFLLQESAMSPADLQDLLYKESGLLGVSGVSGDMRELERSRDLRAREAIDLFAFRVAREVAALTNTLGGLDRVVFTGGIGEHSAVVRGAVCERLRWLGLSLDVQANEKHASHLALHESRVDIRIIPTDEEVMIARHTVATVARLAFKP